MNNIIIAIDGHSSTGKSTLAKQLARALNYVYVDTGAMYRAITYFALKNNYISDNQLNKNALIAHLSEAQLKFVYNDALGFAEIYLNGENIENQIRGMEVSQWVSPVATIPEVRRDLVLQQQKMGEKKGIVMDGRDIGTVVFPDAELKLFVTASAEIRAQRRYEELRSKGEEITYKDVLQNVTERDHIDSSREDSPLKKAVDSIEIDNSKLSIDEQFEKVLQLAKEKIK